MFSKYLIYLCFMCMIKNCIGEVFPSEIQPCKIGDTECISKTATFIVQNFSKGLPNFHLIQLDPFHVDQLVINKGESGPIHFDLSFYDLDIFGFSKFVFDRAVGFTEDPRTSKFEMHSRTPKLHLKGKYKANGKILVLPIQGDGNFEIELINVKFSVKFKPNVTQKNNKTILEINKVKVLTEPDGFKINLENLFNGDPTLGKQMNAFINENWKDVWSDLAPSINEAVAEVIRIVMLPLFKHYAYEDIYKKS